MGSFPANYEVRKSRTDDIFRLRRWLTSIFPPDSFDQFRSCTMFGRSMRKCAALMLSTVMVDSGLRVSGIGHTSSRARHSPPQRICIQISAPSRELFFEPLMYSEIMGAAKPSSRAIVSIWRSLLQAP